MRRPRCRARHPPLGRSLANIGDQPAVRDLGLFGELPLDLCSAGLAYRGGGLGPGLTARCTGHQLQAPQACGRVRGGDAWKA